MAEVGSGIRSILSLSMAYRAFDKLMGAESAREKITSEYLRLEGGERVLDAGCGTAAIYAHLPSVTYVGFDPSEQYIDAATKRFGDDVDVRIGTVKGTSFGPEERFDLVMAIGVVHHLDDDEAQLLFERSAEYLRPGGRLVTVDPCLAESQSRLSRFLVKRDRGQNVRTEQGYLELAASAFSATKHETRSDLLRIPYTHFIMQCSKP